MKRVFLAIICLCLISLVGCSVEPSKIEKSEAKKMAKKITYFRDTRTGLCFATIASRKTGQASQSGLGLSYVPCKLLIPSGVEVYNLEEK